MPEALATLGRFAAGLTLADVPPAARARACLIVLDTIGAVQGGWMFGDMRAVGAWARREGGPAARALAAGTSGVSHELDEGHAASRGHPAIHVVPALLSHAASLGVRGGDLLTALVAGYEVGARVGMATRLRAACHPHGTWGAVAAAAGVGRLLALDADRMTSALRLAACLPVATSYQALRDGSSVRHVWAGMANLAGSLAAFLARDGVTGPVHAPADVLARIVGEAFDPAVACADLGSRWEVAHGYFKLHACCRHGHATLDALGAALGERRVEPGQVEAVDVATYADAVRVMSGPAAPATPLAAKFSLAYVSAARIVRGEVAPGAFAAEALGDPRVLALATRVRVRADEALSALVPGARGARVEVALATGERLRGEVAHSQGDPALPIDRETMIDKFRALAAPGLGAEHAEAVIAAALALEALDSVQVLADALCA